MGRLLVPLRLWRMLVRTYGERSAYTHAKKYQQRIEKAVVLKKVEQLEPRTPFQQREQRTRARRSAFDYFEQRISTEPFLDLLNNDVKRPPNYRGRKPEKRKSTSTRKRSAKKGKNSSGVVPMIVDGGGLIQGRKPPDTSVASSGLTANTAVSAPLSAVSTSISTTMTASSSSSAAPRSRNDNFNIITISAPPLPPSGVTPV